MIRRGFIKLLCAGNVGLLAASVSRGPLELLGIEDVSELETIPDSPILMPGVGLQGYIRRMDLSVDRDTKDYIRRDGSVFSTPGMTSAVASFDVLLTMPAMGDGLNDLMAGGYVHIISAKPPT